MFITIIIIVIITTIIIMLIIILTIKIIVIIVIKAIIIMIKINQSNLNGNCINKRINFVLPIYNKQDSSCSFRLLGKNF